MGGRIRNAVKLAERCVCACISPVASNFISSCCTSHSVIFFISLLPYIKAAKWLQRGEEHSASSFASKCASRLLPRPPTVARLFSLNANIYKNAYFWFRAAVAHTHTSGHESLYLHLCCGTASGETSFHCKIMTLHLLPHTKWSTLDRNVTPFCF